MTADNFLGFSQTLHILMVILLTIQVVGSVDDAQSGLTTGFKHFVQNGGIGLTADDPSVEAGQQYLPHKYWLDSINK